MQNTNAEKVLWKRTSASWQLDTEDVMDDEVRKDWNSCFNFKATYSQLHAEDPTQNKMVERSFANQSEVKGCQVNSESAKKVQNIWGQ